MTAESHIPQGFNDRKIGLSILSLGFTLDLWDDPANAFGDPLTGISGYSDFLSSFSLIAHSPHHRNLEPLRLADNFWAYATNAYTPLDSWLRMFNFGVQAARKTPIDLIHVREPLYSGSIGYFLSRKLHVPMHVCVYGTNPFDPYWEKESWINRAVAPVARKILRSAQGIQVDGSATARSLSKLGIPAERVSIKPDIPGNLSNFVDARPDTELRETLSENGRFERLILCVGRAEPQKNWNFLLDLAAKFVADGLAARFIVIGDGLLRPRLEKEARDRNLSDRFVWAGFQPHRQVVKYMATCDIFALCSLYEGFAKVLMEAGMAAMPIVTTAVSGSDDAVVPGKSGYIVPVGDIDAFTKALAALIHDPGRATDMGLQARQHIQTLVTRYSDPRYQVRIWEDVVSKWKSSERRHEL